MDLAIARALHVLAVVIWIGGVAMVTSVILPSVRRLRHPEEQLALFEQVERRFVWQARGAIALAGLSGVYLVWRLDLWSRFVAARFWWMHAMVAIWFVFGFIVFVAEPLFLNAWLERRAREAPEATLRLVQRLHWVLLTLSVLTILGAVAGSHGFYWPS
ncbi:MAG: hypothetical protein WAW96_21675 [Alphaproteobacteria bacterium]